MQLAFFEALSESQRWPLCSITCIYLVLNVWTRWLEQIKDVSFIEYLSTNTKEYMLA